MGEGSAGVERRLVTRPGRPPDAEVPGAFAAADAAVMPYRTGFAGVSGPLVLAGAYGVPVVASDPPGLADVVRRHDVGTVCRAGDPVDVARAVRHALANGSPTAAATASFRTAHAMDTYGRALVAAYGGDAPRADPPPLPAAAPDASADAAVERPAASGRRGAPGRRRELQACRDRSRRAARRGLLDRGSGDSTFIVLDALLTRGRRVRPHDVHDPERPSAARELRTMEEVRSARAAARPKAAARLAPLVVVEKGRHPLRSARRRALPHPGRPVPTSRRSTPG